MSFLSPLSFLLATLAVPLLLLYFLKVRRRQQVVSSLLLCDSSRCARDPSARGRVATPPVGLVPARSRGVRVLPAPAARPAHAAADPRPARADLGAGP